MSTQRNIQNGPSNFDLMMSLFDGKVINFDLETETRTAGQQSSSAKFKINEKVNVRISSLEHEDGSGNRWLLKGSTKAEGLFEGYYDHNSRKGYLKFKNPKFKILEKM